MNFERERECLKEIVTTLRKSFDNIDREIKKVYFRERCDIVDEILKENFGDLLTLNYRGISDNLKINLKMIERKEIKCVFIGKTSSGKSAVINRLLGQEVLPSSIGSATAHFIRITGCENEEGYIMDVDKQQKDITKMKKLATQRDNDKTTLELFYPISKCPLLSNKVELFDCPGVDYDEGDDIYIKECCEDTDLFVLVCDCNSGLNQSEKRLIKIINEKVVKPNVIVLINKWDLTESMDMSEKEEVKEDFKKTITIFLGNDFQIYKFDSLFFVSALKHFVEGEETFKKFEETLMHEIKDPENIKNIKIKPHKEKINRITLDWNELMDKQMDLHSQNTQKYIEIMKKDLKEKLYKTLQDVLYQKIVKMRPIIKNVVRKYLEEEINKSVKKEFLEESENYKGKTTELFGNKDLGKEDYSCEKEGINTNLLVGHFQTDFDGIIKESFRDIMPQMQADTNAELRKQSVKSNEEISRFIFRDINLNNEVKNYIISALKKEIIIDDIRLSLISDLKNKIRNDNQVVMDTGHNIIDDVFHHESVEKDGEAVSINEDRLRKMSLIIKRLLLEIEQEKINKINTHFLNQFINNVYQNDSEKSRTNVEKDKKNLFRKCVSYTNRFVSWILEPNETASKYYFNELFKRAFDQTISQLSIKIISDVINKNGNNIQNILKKEFQTKVNKSIKEISQETCSKVRQESMNGIRVCLMEKLQMDQREDLYREVWSDIRYECVNITKDNLNKQCRECLDQAMNNIKCKFDDFSNSQSKFFAQFYESIGKNENKIQNYNDFSMEMSAIFKDTIIKLRENLKENFIKNSVIKMNKDRIQEYFEQHIHFTHIADKFNSYRESELRKFINDINIIFNNEEDNNFLSNWLIQMDIKELKNSLNQRYMPEGTAGCTNTNLIEGDSNSNAQYKSSPEYNKALEDGIVNILKKYLDILIEPNLNQARSVMKQEIEECVEKYMEDQRRTIELLNKLIIERRTIVNINERTKNQI